MNSLNIISTLTWRNTKIFLKDKLVIFFSFLSPLIVLVVFFLFLREIQVKEFNNFIGNFNNFLIDKNKIPDSSIINASIVSLMLSGLITMVCVTIALTSNSQIIKDKKAGLTADLKASPVKPWIGRVAYFLSNLLTTLIFIFIILIITFIYLISAQQWYLSVEDTFGLIGLAIFSTISGSLVTSFIVSLFTSEGQLSGFNAVSSIAIGFFIGAFYPIASMPNWFQTIVVFIPASHSAGLFRYLFLNGMVEHISSFYTKPEVIKEALETFFSFKIQFFNISINSDWQAYILAFSIVIFMGAMIGTSYITRSPFHKFKNK